MKRKVFEDEETSIGLTNGGGSKEAVFRIPLSRIDGDKVNLNSFLEFKSDIAEKAEGREPSEVQLYPPKIYLLNAHEHEEIVAEQKNNTELRINAASQQTCPYNYLNGEYVNEPLNGIPFLNHQKPRTLLCKSLEAKIIEPTIGLKAERRELNCWVGRFVKFIAYIPACCDRIKNLFEWFLSCGEAHLWSQGDENRKIYTYAFLDFFTEICELREYFREWLISFSDIIMSESKSKNHLKKEKLFFNFLQELITAKNYLMQQRIANKLPPMSQKIFNRMPEFYRNKFSRCESDYGENRIERLIGAGYLQSNLRFKVPLRSIRDMDTNEELFLRDFECQAENINLDDSDEEQEEAQQEDDEAEF